MGDDTVSPTSRRGFLLRAGLATVAAVNAPILAGSDPGRSGGVRSNKWKPVTGPIRLDRNENPLGPSPSVLQVLSRAMERAGLYPEADARSLREAIAAYHRLPPSWVVPTCGATEALAILFETFVREGDRVVLASPPFHLVGRLLEGSMAQGRFVPVVRGRLLEPAEVLAAIDRRTRAVLMVNPHNPTGSVLDRPFFAELLARFPVGPILAVDEAYHHYAAGPGYASCEPLVSAHPRLVVIRSMSKAHGLAGLRVGYMLAQEPVALELERRRIVAAVGSLAELAVIAALEDRAHVERSVRSNRLARGRLQAGLRGLGLDPWPSSGSFVYLEPLPGAGRIAAALHERGIRVHVVPGPSSALRVSVGTEAQVDRLLECLGPLVSR
jgi:histidinol-phosphate aminotransferase